MSVFSRGAWPSFAVASGLADLVWPLSCAGCGVWGPALCESCRGELVPRDVRTNPVWAPDLEVRAASVFDGSVRTVITAFKDEERSDMGPCLGAMLRCAVGGALRDAPIGPRQWCVVGAPSSATSMRRRGRFPLGELVAAVAGSRLRLGPQLRVCRPVRDQSLLSRTQRRTNLSGAYAPTPGATLAAGTGIVLVDDVVTTGATLAAMREAVLPLRPQAVVAATIAATGGIVARTDLAQAG